MNSDKEANLTRISREGNSAARKVCLSFARGCPRSELDIALLAEYFRRNGWQSVNRFFKADLIIVGTCGFSESAEEESLALLRRVREKAGPDAQVVAVGCLPGINRERLADEPGILALARTELGLLDDIISADIKLSLVNQTMTTRSDVYTARRVFSVFDRAKARMYVLRQPVADSFLPRLFTSLAGYWGSSHHFSFDDKRRDVFALRVSAGCDAECTYCAIKSAVGPLHSEPVDIIIPRMQTALSSGFKIFELVAEDLGAYGQDTGSDIFELLNAIFSLPDRFVLSWDDFSPKWLVRYYSGLRGIIGSNIGRIGHLGFPLQSGSRRIVELMNRGYDPDEVRSCLLGLRSSFPHLLLTTHVIAGFPGETREEFEETMDFIKTVGFERVYLYPYSDRPNTSASLMPCKVSESEKMQRVWAFCRQFRGVVR